MWPLLIQSCHGLVSGLASSRRFCSICCRRARFTQSHFLLAIRLLSAKQSPLSLFIMFIYAISFVFPTFTFFLYIFHLLHSTSRCYMYFFITMNFTASKDCCTLEPNNDISLYKKSLPRFFCNDNTVQVITGPLSWSHYAPGTWQYTTRTCRV